MLFRSGDDDDDGLDVGVSLGAVVGINNGVADIDDDDDDDGLGLDVGVALGAVVGINNGVADGDDDDD